MTERDEDAYERVLVAFKEVAREATNVRSPDSLDTLLRLTGRRICELIGVHRCSVYLQVEDGLFHGRVGYCVSEAIDARIKPLVSGMAGDLFTQQIVATKAPVLITDARHDARTIQRTMRRWGVHDMLGVPLVISEEVIGIIYVDDLEAEHVYSEQDIRVAQTFASLAALAIRQASLLSEVNQRALVIDEQHRVLAHAESAHERLTSAVLSGLDLAGVVRLLVDLLGKPVFVFNERPDLMAGASRERAVVSANLVGAALGSGEAGLATAIRRTDPAATSVVLPPAPALGCPHRRLVCPMVVEGRVAGYVVVLELGGRFSPLDTRIGQHGATVVTLQLFTELRQDAARQQSRQEFLGDLLHGGRDPQAVVRRGQVLGVDLTTPHVLVRVRDSGGVATETGAARRAWLSIGVAAALGLPDVIATGVPGASVLLVALPAGEELAGARAVKMAVAAVLARKLPADPPSAVISVVCRELREYPKAYLEARRVMEMLDRIGRYGHVELAGELGVSRLIAASVPSAQAVQFAREVLAPILAHDAGSGGELMPTLRTFLTEGGQIRGTARQLGVHENTVRYRLARIKEISIVDPDRLDSMLDLRFCLQILDLVDGLTPSNSRPRPDELPTPPGR